MKRIVCLLMACVLLVMAIPVSAAGSYGFSISDGVITMDADSSAVRAECTLSSGTTSYQFAGNLSQSHQIGLPIRQLPLAEYSVEINFYDASGNIIGTANGTYTLGVESPSSQQQEQGVPPANDPSRSRAIMSPYAKVYSSGSLTGEPVAELKRHDVVNVLNISGRVAYIKAVIQSGDGTIVNESDTDARYESSNDLTVYGYVDTSAFDIPLSSYAVDKQREVAELAYARLGLRGVYSQSRRYIDWYLDCSALAAWCWYQVGIDMGQFGTSCTGLAQWATSKGNVVVWEAKRNTEKPAQEIADYKASLPDCLCPVDGGCGCGLLCDCNDTPDPLEFGESKFGTIGEKNLVWFDTYVTQDVLNSLEPGDIIFFNKKEDLTCQYESLVSHTFTYYVNEGADGSDDTGYEHVAVFVGLKDDGSAIIIESSSPSEIASKNTKVSTLIAGSDRANTIGRIVRPIGS